MSTQPNVIIPVLFYRDVRTAFDWLADTYGFTPDILFQDDQDNIIHAEMTLGPARIMVGPTELAEWSQSPAAMNGHSSQQLYVYVDDVMAHHNHAAGAGADIAAPPEAQFYGDKTYRTTDIEGHRWVFAEKIRTVGRDEMAQATGLRVT